jgi:hypothetical protein
VVSAAAAISAGLVMATVELELAMVLAAMARAIMHPESQRDATSATAAIAATGKGTMHREAQLDGRFIVLLPVRKAEPLPGSLLGRQIDLEVTTFPVINPALALRANPASSNTLAQLQRVQPGPTGLGRDRMQPTGSDSTRKQNKGCVTGKAKRLDTPTPNVITMNTGKIASTMTMTGGVTIATLSFLLGEVFGAGLTAGGIRPGGTTRIIRTTIITARSMVMTACNQTR